MMQNGNKLLLARRGSRRILYACTVTAGSMNWLLAADMMKERQVSDHLPFWTLQEFGRNRYKITDKGERLWVHMRNLHRSMICSWIILIMKNGQIMLQIILENMRLQDGLVLELGCGTGTMTGLLAGKGYDMIGVDNSEEMLAEAMEKRVESGQDILYLLQDMQEFELYGTVRAVVSVCDSLNYITDRDELRTCV